MGSKLKLHDLPPPVTTQANSITYKNICSWVRK